MKYNKDRLSNISRKSTIKTFLKKINLNILNKNKNEANKLFLQAQSYIDRQVSKKLIHKNKSSRYKSKIIKKINNI